MAAAGYNDILLLFSFQTHCVYCPAGSSAAFLPALTQLVIDPGLIQSFGIYGGTLSQLLNSIGSMLLAFFNIYD
jgi:hypothetical protein